MPRCALDEEAVLLLVGRGARVPCRIVELSLTGCRMRTRERLSAGGELRVEATFKVHGIAFRFGGAIEWAEDTGLVGIRFVELIPRRRDELIEVLCELEAEIAAKAETEASERRAADERASQEAENRRRSQPMPCHFWSGFGLRHWRFRPNSRLARFRRSKLPKLRPSQCCGRFCLLLHWPAVHRRSAFSPIPSRYRTASKTSQT